MSDKLYLYEIGNGWMAASYYRVYVIAADDDQALRLAVARFEAAGKSSDDYRIAGRVAIREGFVSVPDGEGLVIEGKDAP